MRLVSEIPHSRFKIQIHSYNSRFIVKIELGQYEQTYKINESDVSGLEEVEKMVTTELLRKSLLRFIEMREDWEDGFSKKNVK
ncbi:MAG: hypothetical protein DCO96_05195 [Fluviicola sp. XM-24bin1]|nr:MAG: hypothetical protein DCO96_05195 [Fluviicola sp. XM-24bin1]